LPWAASQHRSCEKWTHVVAQQEQGALAIEPDLGVVARHARIVPDEVALHVAADERTPSLERASTKQRRPPRTP
jgi:hypothetical protein